VDASWALKREAVRAVSANFRHTLGNIEVWSTIFYSTIDPKLLCEMRDTLCKILMEASSLDSSKVKHMEQ